jgi:glycosyltransferase involved in cell wall biosynthesis
MLTTEVFPGAIARSAAEVAVISSRVAALKADATSERLFAASFTVAICTLNRLDLLRETAAVALEQLADFPQGRLLIVDNGSEDGTLCYLEQLAADNPNVRLVLEPVLGIYHARKTAIAEAEGDYLVFLDDDVLPGEGWLALILAPLVNEPTVGISTGISFPRWLAPRPDWLPDRFLDEFSLIGYSGRRIQCHFPYYPPAMAMAIRRHGCLSLFSHPRRLALALGRRSTNDANPIFTGEDSDLCEIYVRNGFDVIIDDRPIVEHAIHTTRLTPDWLLRKFRMEGRARVALCRLFGWQAVSRHSWLLLAAWPALALGWALAPLLTRKRALLFRAYFEKSTGAWQELAFGARSQPLPMKLSDLHEN